ncbi:MAG: hypothetical protein GTO13_07480 [Proteobacteria bacterium]|nr:hypothetical protein [Pseudomonadota bacterium]
MEPIYDPAGAIVAWKRGDDIHDVHGQAVAFVSNKNVVSYSGRYLGVLDKGLFRDHHGDPVAFMRGATGGPVLPVPSEKPVPPVPAVAPARPEPPIPPVPGVPSLRWSSLSWEQFLAGK